MSLKQFNKQGFNREVFKFVKSNLNNHDVDLFKQLKYAFTLSAPWREKAYLLFSVGTSLGVKEENLLPFAIASELIMAAALTADDIFDRSLKRENKISSYKKMGANKTFLIAETMFALAIKAIATSFQAGNKDVKPKIQQKIIKLFVDAHLGIQRFQYWRSSRSADSLMSLTPEIINEKYGMSVGQLFVATLATPVYLTKQQDKLEAFKLIGKSLGIGLQLNNDITDFAWTQSNLGRNGLEDLYNGQPNIVLTLLLKNRILNTQDKNYIINIWTNDLPGYKRPNKKVKKIIQQSGIIEIAKQYLTESLFQANKKVDDLSDKNLQIKIKEIMRIMCDV